MSDVTVSLNAAHAAFVNMTRAMSGIAEVMLRFHIPVVEERCDYSWLFTTQCAHCLGHTADWEVSRKVKAYEYE